MAATSAAMTLPRDVQSLLKDSGNDITFSVASLWEIIIKNGRGRTDFVVDAGELRQAPVAPR
ncbi:hypothetical protein [Methylocystis sp. S23]